MLSSSDDDFWADLGLKPYFEHENGAVHLVIAQIRTCTCCAGISHLNLSSELSLHNFVPPKLMINVPFLPRCC